MISLRRLIRAYPPVLGLLVNVLPSGVGYIAFGLLMKRLFELMMTEPEVRGIVLTCAGLAGIAIMRFLAALVMVPIEARARHAFGSVLRVGLVEAGIDGKRGPTSGGAHTCSYKHLPAPQTAAPLLCRLLLLKKNRPGPHP